MHTMLPSLSCHELLCLFDLPAFCADLVEVCHVGNGAESVAESLLDFLHVAHPARQRYTQLNRSTRKKQGGKFGMCYVGCDHF